MIVGTTVWGKLRVLIHCLIRFHDLGVLTCQTKDGSRSEWTCDDCFLGRRRVMTRQEHLERCKQRALEYADAGDTQNAWASMASDLGKHPETANHAGIQLGMMQMMGGMLSTPQEMRKFIEGFN